MPIVTHGAEITLAPTIAPIVRQAPATGGTVRAAVDLLVRQGFAAMQLDAALPGVRPRELSERGRKDLLAMVGRAGARITGVELFIPRQHFTDSQHVDRAMAATIAAIALAADLGRVPLSVALPVAMMPDDQKSALVDAADSRGARLAVHAEDQLDALLAWVEKVDLYALGVGIDPAALLASAVSPHHTVNRIAKRVAVARLDDIAAGGAGAPRTVVGKGELDVLPYRIAVDLAKERTGPVILDLRGLADPLAAAVEAKRVWDANSVTG